MVDGSLYIAVSSYLHKTRFSATSSSFSPGFSRSRRTEGERNGADSRRRVYVPVAPGWPPGRSILSRSRSTRARRSVRADEVVRLGLARGERRAVERVTTTTPLVTSSSSPRDNTDCANGSVSRCVATSSSCLLSDEAEYRPAGRARQGDVTGYTAG